VKNSFTIGGFDVGDNRDILFVAEIGGNHNGDINLALRMIDAAVAAGAQAVKFQTYVTGQFLVRGSPYFETFKREELPFEAFSALCRHAAGKGLIFFSTPFDFESVDFLASIDVPLFKVASGDINNFPLLERIAEKDRPMILSTGASTGDDVEKAVSFLRGLGVTELALMQCTALYPAPDSEMDLRVISAFRERYGFPVGLSDHSTNPDISLAACALGASIIEKHFTIDRSFPGGDNDISILPEEFALLIERCRHVKKALGRSEKVLSPSEAEVQGQIRRSPVAKRSISSGEVLTEESVAIKRPMAGAPPDYYFSLIGKRAACDIKEDEPITPEKVIAIV
jgi:N,N'-diacetyllegionaminate synthase